MAYRPRAISRVLSSNGLRPMAVVIWIVEAEVICPGRPVALQPLGPEICRVLDVSHHGDVSATAALAEGTTS